MTNQASDEERFSAEYAQYIQTVLRPTRDQARTVFRWKEPTYWSKYRSDSRLSLPSPVQRIHSRIKRPESVQDKIHRQPARFPGPLSSAFRTMRDALGFRIVVYFTSQLPLIHEEILSNSMLEVSATEPPMAYLAEDLKRDLHLDLPGSVRDTGYASVHYILRLTESSIPITDRPWFEVQVRTLVEDTWAEIHHILGYKPDKRTSLAVRRQFNIIGKMLGTIDEHFNFLSEELGRFQKEAPYDTSSPLNAENLPGVLNEFDLVCAQREVDGLLKVLNSRGIPTVGDFRRIATDSRIQRITDLYEDETKSQPNTFDVVAHLANLAGVDPANIDEERRLIATQIAIFRDWEDRHKP
jgi:putative GTP pyrophosphokinase